MCSAGETPLHFAARAGHADAVEELLSQGADPTIVGQFGTPADVALTSNQTACFNLLCGTSDAWPFVTVDAVAVVVVEWRRWSSDPGYLM